MPRLEMSKKLKDRLVRGKNYIPRHREFVAELIQLAGGPRQLAALLVKALNDPKTTPAVRNRAIEIMLNALKRVDLEEPPADPTTLTDEELEQFIDERIALVLEAEGGPDGAEEGPGPAEEAGPQGRAD